MGLITPANCTVSIYAGSNASSPYSLGGLRSTVQAVLIPRVQDGRYGSAQWLKWTHVLLLPPGTEVHDAYNSQLDPNRNNALGDTVVLAGTSGTVAYYVAFVEVISRGTAGAHLRAYLDRFQPQSWPTDGL